METAIMGYIGTTIGSSVIDSYVMLLYWAALFQEGPWLSPTPVGQPTIPEAPDKGDS